MVISTKQKQTRSIDNFNLNLIMNNLKLKIVTEQKLLGILVTNTLNWNKHVDHVCEKISKRIFFNAYILLPHFEYIQYYMGP